MCVVCYVLLGLLRCNEINVLEVVVNNSKGTNISHHRRGMMHRLRREFPEYDAVIHMARIANDEENDTLTRFNASKEVAQYIYPKLRSMDMTTNGEGVQFNFSIGQQGQPILQVDNSKEVIELNPITIKADETVVESKG